MGPVVYVAAEGQDKLAKRIKAWMSHWDVEDLSRLRIVEAPINLLERPQVEELIVEVQQGLGPSALIVFDTLHRSMAGGDENSAKDIGIVIDHIDRIRQELGCAALLLHHPGYNSTRILHSRLIGRSVERWEHPGCEPVRWWSVSGLETPSFARLGDAVGVVCW